MVEIKEFTLIYFEDLKRLHAKQQSPTTDFIFVDTLPKIGVVVLAESKPISFGFLRLLEGGFGQIDTIVTDPDAVAEDRHQALNLITENLVNTAKSIGLRGVYGITQHEAIIKRAISLGFNGTVQIVFSMML